MSKLLHYLKNYRKQLILGPAFKLIEAVFELMIPLLMAKIIDIGIQNGDIAYILRTGGLILLLGGVGLCSALTCQYFASVASQGFGTVLRNELFAHINTLSHREIEKIGTPSLITRMTNDINQLQLAVAMLIRLVIRAPFLGVGAIVMATIVDWKTSLIFWSATPLIALIFYLVTKRSVPAYRMTQKMLDRLSLLSGENLDGARVIRAFSRQKKQNEAFDKAAEDYSAAAMRAARWSALLNPANFIIVNFAIIAILWFGGTRAENGFLLRGDIIALVNYMTQTFLALVVVVNLVVLFSKAAASAQRVSEVLDLQTSVTDGDYTGASPKEGDVLLSMKDVRFSYTNSEKYALQDVNFQLNKGQTLGIVGATGSGKSTLASLMMRFYDVSCGEILWNGRKISEYSLETLRGQIALVPQSPALFSGSIADNLRWGKKDATDEEMRAALETAQAWDFAQELGLDTPIVQGGKNLSGGQLQRLTIARALIKKPQLLILDDSFSSLDYLTDLRLRQAMRQEKAAVVMISQRISSIMNADNIIVLAAGRIAGMGSHAFLMENCPLYLDICRSQEVETA